jgi:TDG/mug DNA glycosylase family protein
MNQPRPTRAELLAAVDQTVPDVIARDLAVLFCGINPGLYSAYTGHHFARPGNRFWPALHAGGFTERLLSPYEERELLERGYGITNVVNRASAAADELSAAELTAGGEELRARVKRYRPKYLAVLGVGAYRVAFDRPKAVLGLQSETVGSTKVWVLPNPSGLNAHYRARDLAKLFGELRDAVEAKTGPT